VLPAIDGKGILVNGKRIELLDSREPEQLDWKVYLWTRVNAVVYFITISVA
jgi:glyceraldehyde-3-phosphate dehydrogenase/erythrose-4-phosphate dehydrogenase